MPAALATAVMPGMLQARPGAAGTAAPDPDLDPGDNVTTTIVTGTDLNDKTKTKRKRTPPEDQQFTLGSTDIRTNRGRDPTESVSPARGGMATRRGRLPGTRPPRASTTTSMSRSMLSWLRNGPVSRENDSAGISRRGGGDEGAGRTGVLSEVDGSQKRKVSGD